MHVPGNWLGFRATVAIALALAALAGTARAADNTATGDIAGDASDLTDSNTFTLNTTTLAIVKTAFLTDGTPLTSGTSLARGTLVHFLVYIDNATAVSVDDVNVEDVLDAAFAYQASSIRVDNSVATGSNAAAIYAAVSAAPTLDDGVDGTDVAGITGATISVGTGAGNAQLDLAPSAVWAALFTVEMQ